VASAAELRPRASGRRAQQTRAVPQPATRRKPHLGGRPSLSDAAEARRALGALVATEDGQIDLARAALLVAREEYADVDGETYLAQLDHLGQTLRDRVATEAAPERQIAAANALLFGEEGFRGNPANYYDPRNSYLNEVLDRRLGIPITLALVYIEVGQRARLPLSGVGFPAHFLVAYEAEPRVLIDPFNCGRILSVADCQRLLYEAFGNSARLEPWHMAASSKRQILARLVTNLKLAYERAGDLQRAVRASEQLSVVQPSAAELRERGLLRFRSGDFVGASADLGQYLEFEPAATDADAVRRQIALIRELRERRN
jgi:regulator of sirC expression with transglutaminase-like and TPR domain